MLVLVQADLSRSQETCEDQRRKINKVNNQLKAEQADLRKAHLDLEKACSDYAEARSDLAKSQAHAEAMQNAAQVALQGQRAAKKAAKEAAQSAVQANTKAQAQMQQQQHQAANPGLLQIAKSASDHCARGTCLNISSSLGELLTQYLVSDSCTFRSAPLPNAAPAAALYPGA